MCYTMTMPCDRCFEMTTQEREMPFFHVLVRELSDEEDEDGQFVWYRTSPLDLEQLLTEDILLMCPASSSVPQIARACALCVAKT